MKKALMPLNSSSRARLSLNKPTIEWIVENKLFYFQIPINDIILMQKSNCIANFSTIKSSFTLAEFSLSCQMKKELTAVHVLHY